MKLRAFRPQKARGFRLSVPDILIGAAAAGLSWAVTDIPELAILWPLPVHVFATFFLFCNICRIGTRQELFWLSTITASLAGAYGADVEPYPAILFTTVPSAILAVGWSASAGRYNGVAHQAVGRIVANRKWQV
jgi:hypothetical protein